MFEMYIDRCRKVNINTVVFYGYNKWTKSAAHKARSNKMFQIVEINDANVCPLDRADFLTNYTNKQNFVNLLVYKLELYVFKAMLCLTDAYTTIVKTSSQIQDKPVTVLADHTDILCLPLHHKHYSNNKNEIYIKNMQIQNNIDERVSYNIDYIVNSTGEDKTSQIHNFGKKSIYSKLKFSKDLQHLPKHFYRNSATVNDIENASIRVFELLHSTSSNLQQMRE